MTNTDKITLPFNPALPHEGLGMCADQLELMADLMDQEGTERLSLSEGGRAGMVRTLRGVIRHIWEAQFAMHAVMARENMRASAEAMPEAEARQRAEQIMQHLATIVAGQDGGAAPGGVVPPAGEAPQPRLTQPLPPPACGSAAA